MRHALTLLGLASALAATTVVGAWAQESAPGSTTQTDATTQAAAQSDQPAKSTEASWPCDQPERLELSVGSVWQGPDPTSAEDGWHDVPAVVSLVEQIAPRRMARDDAIAAIHRFSAGYGNGDRATALTQVFAGLFETLDKERREIINGIRHFNRRQDALAKRIETGWTTMDTLDPNSTDPAVGQKRATLQQAIDWDSRIFDDRQRLLPEVCRQPIVIEQRLFALSRALQQDLDGSNP